MKMIKFQYLILILGLIGGLLFMFVKREEDEEGKTWILLAAGSQGIENYRHQADVCHAYQLIRAGGVLDEHIIAFHFNDIARHKHNPSIGTIRHVEGGQDLYPGLPWDYTGSDANSTNFMAALAGRRDLVEKNKRVIMSSSKDRIFVFFSGHGQPDLLHMPVLGDAIHKEQLMETLVWMRKKNKFKSMVLYIGACHSGCLFKPDVLVDKSIYIVTATNCSHPSYGTSNSWWGTHSQSWSTHFGRAWICDSEQHDRKTRSIGEQFDEVKRNLSTRSTVMQFGSMELKIEELFRYHGFKKERRFWWYK